MEFEKKKGGENIYKVATPPSKIYYCVVHAARALFSFLSLSFITGPR
jgi:hypothetical protein